MTAERVLRALTPGQGSVKPQMIGIQREIEEAGQLHIWEIDLPHVIVRQVDDGLFLPAWPQPRRSKAILD